MGMAQKKEKKTTLTIQTAPKPNRLTEFVSSPAFPWVLRGLFFGVVFVLLGFVYEDVLLQYFERSYFLYDLSFAYDKIARSGGLLVYLSLFLNQLFAHPIVAALVIALLLTVLQCWISRWVDDRYFLNFLVPILLLFYFLDASYSIYWGVMAFMWTPLLGLFYTMGVAELLNWSTRKLGNEKIVFGGALLLSVSTFPLLGIFSFLPNFFWSALKKDKKGWIFVALFFLMVWVVSECYHEHIVYALKAPFALQRGRTFPWFGICASLILPFLTMVKMEKIKSYWSIAGLLGLYAALFFYVSSPANVNFRLDMCLLSQTERQDWEGVKRKVSELDQVTHVQNSFRIIALANTDQLESQLFHFPLPYEEHPLNDGSGLFVSTAYVQLYASMFSVASQMNMEQWTMFGPSNAGLKMFALLSILTDNDRLARRYIAVMKKAAGLSEEAEKFETWLNDKAGFYHDNPSFFSLKNNQFVEDYDLNAKSHLAYLLLQHRKLNEENMERRLLANLYVRRLDGFLSDFSFVRPDKYSVWPQYYQEAFILKAMAVNNMQMLEKLPIDKKLIDKVTSLIRIVQRAGKKSMVELAREVYPKYQNMYSYYYLFPDMEKMPDFDLEKDE